jgi:membrane protein involved in colicin uptake
MRLKGGLRTDNNLKDILSIIVIILIGLVGLLIWWAISHIIEFLNK